MFGFSLFRFLKTSNVCDADSIPGLSFCLVASGFELSTLDKFDYRGVTCLQKFCRFIHAYFFDGIVDLLLGNRFQKLLDFLKLLPEHRYRDHGWAIHCVSLSISDWSECRLICEVSVRSFCSLRVHLQSLLTKAGSR